MSTIIEIENQGLISIAKKKQTQISYTLILLYD